MVLLHFLQILLNLQFFLLNRVQSLFFFLQPRFLLTCFPLFRLFVLEVLILDASHHFLVLDLSHELPMLIRTKHLLAIIFQLTFLAFLPRVQQPINALFFFIPLPIFNYASFLVSRLLFYQQILNINLFFLDPYYSSLDLPNNPINN